MVERHFFRYALLELSQTIKDFVNMVYIFGLLGFVMGFAMGLGVINVMLRQRSVDEVRSDKSARTIYGLFVWIFAGVGLIIGLWLHGQIF